MNKQVRRSWIAGSAAALTAVTLSAIPVTASGIAAAPAGQAGEQATYLVLAKADAGDAATRAAIARAGGVVTAVNNAIGMYTVTTTSGAFADAARHQAAVFGVTTNRRIGRTPNRAVTSGVARERLLSRLSTSARAGATAPGAARAAQVQARAATDPLASRQWDMEMIRAWRAHAIATGQGVRVGVMDTGIDANHPDIKPNFNSTLSRNFTVDMPDVDGPCAEEPDRSCIDPANVDENGHGTHVAGTIAAPRNGLGMVGVAPDAELVNLRAGQDSGYFFVDATVKALTYAGDNGIDVVNMSFYIDPWLFNCAANPKDTGEQQAEQRTIIEATQRALAYARARGVTLVAAAGNENTDLDRPQTDASSPDYPEGAAHPRTIDNSCLSLPAEGKDVLAVGALGADTMKAFYSNWGYDAVDLSAPGGSYYGRPGVPVTAKDVAAALILGPMPRDLALKARNVNKDTGVSTNPAIVSQCKGKTADTCAYYQYLQGTSMASPHAVGVAALLISRWGKRTKGYDEVGLSPAQVETILKNTATNAPCPRSVYDYPDLPAEYNATCSGSLERNSWYGHGIVDALSAVSRRR